MRGRDLPVVGGGERVAVDVRSPKGITLRVVEDLDRFWMLDYPVS